jgi:ArsR family transcriptional regulator
MKLNAMGLPAQFSHAFKEQADLFRTLGHPARIAILSILRDGEQCVCHLEAKLGLRQSYISQHLMVLRDAGLVEDRRDGWNVFYRLARPQIRRLLDPLGTPNGTRPPRQAVSTAAGDCPCPKCARRRTKRAVTTRTVRSTNA